MPVAIPSLGDGAVLDFGLATCQCKPTAEQALFRRLLDALESEDLTIADRYQRAYWILALLKARCVAVLMRQHLRHLPMLRSPQDAAGPIGDEGAVIVGTLVLVRNVMDVAVAVVPGGGRPGLEVTEGAVHDGFAGVVCELPPVCAFRHHPAMSVVFEHVKVGDLPEAWRRELANPADAHVTVRIDDEPAIQDLEGRMAPASGEDPAFGIWHDREDMAEVAAYLRKIRAPRYQRTGTRNDG